MFVAPSGLRCGFAKSDINTNNKLSKQTWGDCLTERSPRILERTRARARGEAGDQNTGGELAQRLSLSLNCELMTYKSYQLSPVGTVIKV